MIRRPPAPFVTIILLLLCYIFYLHSHDRPSRPQVVPENLLHPHTPAAAKSRITILTFTTKETTYDHISLSNKHAYARKHGYDLHVDFTVPPETFGARRGAVWHKLTMLEEAMSRGSWDWMWWIDYDTLITNSSVKLEDIVEESLAAAEMEGRKRNEVEMLLTADCFPLNAGSMLMRPTQNLRNFMAKVTECGTTHTDMNEQDCLRDLLKANAGGVADRTYFVPQWKINAFPQEIKCYDKYKRGWQIGDFVVHFPGAWAHVKGEDPYGQMMKKYEPFIDMKPPG